MVQETAVHSADNSSDKTVGNIVTENTGMVTSREGLPFSLGQKIELDSFTGNAYIEMMIANDETYHFPQTNHLTFEPRARSSWHTHEGGQILIYYSASGHTEDVAKVIADDAGADLFVLELKVAAVMPYIFVVNGEMK